MSFSTVLFVAFGGIGSFAAGFWLAQLPDSPAVPRPSSPSRQHDRATPTGTGQPLRRGISVPTHPRDWRRLLTTIDPDEVPEMIDAALAIHDADLRAGILSRLLEIWAAGAPDAAFTWVTRQKYPPWFNADRFFRTWAECDPTAAVAHVASLPNRYARWSAAKGAATAWAAGDPRAAQGWFSRLVDSEIRDGAFDGLCLQLAETDPRQAIEFARSKGDSTYLASRLTGILRIQARSDPQAALETLGSLPPDISRGPLCRTIVDSLLAEDPLLAGEFALTIPPSEAQSAALQSVATRLSHDSLETALAWINSTIPAGPIRTSVLRNALIFAAQADPHAVAPLVANLHGNLRRNVASNLAINWVRSDPQAASAWVNQLPADRDRARVQQTLFEFWRRDDRAAATAWLATTDLPEATKQELLARGP